MSEMSIQIPGAPKNLQRKKSAMEYLLPITDELIEMLAAPGGFEKIDKRAYAGMYVGMVDPRAFACAKVSERWLVGRGFLQRSGQAPVPQGDTTIYQNIKIYMSMSQEEKEKAIELHRQATLAGADSGTGGVGIYGVGAGEDQERPALVAAELHQDV